MSKRKLTGKAAILAAAICAAAAMPSWADSITVTPTLDANGLETSFTLALNVTSTQYLCAAWAETDQGADYTAWTNYNFEVLCEVNSETTSWSFAAPKGWGAEMRALRFFLVEKESRPYDTRVEWIESTGAEWINTGYIGQYNDVYDIHFKWTSGNLPIGAYGGSKPGDNKRYGILDIGDGRVSLAMNSQTYSNDPTRESTRKVTSGEELYTRTTMIQGIQTVCANSTGFKDMEMCCSSTIRATAAVANTTAPIYIFARNCGNTSTDITKGGTVDGQSVIRLWSCCATHEGMPVFDFIPCVKDGEAMLYDKVQNRLHRNVSGAGAFVAGPVVEEQLLGATEAASSSVAPARPVALISTTSATTSAVSFSATLAQSASAVSAAFAYGDTPDALGAAGEVSANWTQGAAVTFSATGLSAGARQYGVLKLSQNGAVVRTYGFWFVAAGTEGRAVAVGAEKAGGVIEAVISKAAGTTNVLFVAYGASPGGDTPESWANCERVCLVDGDAQTIDVTVPGWGDTAAAMRFFLKEYDAYPYDAQVKWIAATGNEWINTGYLSRTNDVYQLSFRDDCTNGHFIVGAYGSAGMDANGGTRVTVMQVTKRGDNYYGYGMNYGMAINNKYEDVKSRKMELGADLTLQAEFVSGSQTLKQGRMGGGISFLAGTTYAVDLNCDSPVYVFARNKGNTTTDIAATVSSAGVDNRATARVYSLSITHNGELARDFIPVVKNGVAGLYDRVLKRCHWNVSGVGAFTYGPALPESGGEPGDVAASSEVYLVPVASGTVALRGAYATTADITVTLGSAGAAATANVIFEYGTTSEYGSSVVVDAAMAPGASRDLTVSGLSANTAYFWRVMAGGEEIASGTFTTQGAYRTVALREVVESAGGETLCCKLDFGAAVQNETCRLVLAYGAEEGDVELSSWENCVVVGTVAPGENSLEYNLPAGLITGAFKYRFYLVSDGDSLPGVSKVSYLESTGAEWIDTGWIGTYDDDYDLSFRSLNTRQDWFMMGAYGTALQHRYAVAQADGNGNYVVFIDNSSDGSGNIAAENNADTRLKASYKLGEQLLYISKNGGAFGQAGRLTLSTMPINTIAPLYLFCRNCGNVSVDNVSRAILYFCKIDHNGVRVRDFVPCVKNGEAGLYDMVSGHFYGNVSGNGAFIAGEPVGGEAAVYSYTVPTNGVGVATDHGSKAGAMTAISAVGQRVSATASVTALGLGDTYPYFEWWVEGGNVTNAIAFAAFPANDTAESHEYSTTFDAGVVWGQTVNCRFAVSNVYAGATGGTCVWSDKSGARTVAIVDDCTYTWQDDNGDWNGDWTNSAHWASDRPGNCIGIPTATSSVIVPASADAVIVMPDGTNSVKSLNINAKGMSVTFFNAMGNAALKPAAWTYGDTAGVSWNGQRVVFDGVSLVTPSPATALAVPNSATFALRGGATVNSTNLDLINTANTGYTGRLEIDAGSVWPASGEITMLRHSGEGVIRVEGTLNVSKYLIGQYGSWGGGILEIGGADAAVNVSFKFRCWNGSQYTTPSHVVFDIPAEGWATAPLRGTASADPFAGTASESANVSATIVISVPADAAIIAARKGRTTPFKVPLISWPTGITTDRCELVPGNARRVRLAWTYGGTDSEVDDGNLPTGLVAYISGAPGTMLIVR